MKKTLAIILFVIMAVSSIALASPVQTREGVIMLEGMEEPVTETLYESVNGFSLWYPADTFAIVQENGNDVIRPADASIEGVSLIIVPVDIPVEESEALILEATGGYMPGEAEISEIAEWQLESGLNVKSVDALCEGVINRFYLITGHDRVYCLTATYSLEAAEGFGARLDHIVATFEVVTGE